MGFTQMSFLPSLGLRDKETYPTTPLSESEARGAVQGISDQLRDYLNGTLIAELQSVITNFSGADRIGSATIPYVNGNTVRDQIADLKEQIDDFISGSVSDGAITQSKLADDAVTEGKIAANSVSTTKLAAGAVTGDKIAGGAVTGDKIAAGAVDGSSLTDGSVGATKIADLAVGETKLASSAVTRTKIMDGEVTGSKLAAGAVGADKLGTIASITMASEDTLSYDNGADRLVLGVSGCTAVQLCPVVFGTSATPPSGTFPAGTLYIQYQA